MNARDTLILKDTPRRRVHLEFEHGRAVRVVKTIPTSGLLGLRARRLARREFEVQRRLHAAGLAVPEPLEFVIREGVVEVVQRYVDGARELGVLLDGEFGGRPERIGALLGEAHGLGLDHPDLHERNVLLDGHGKAWLIDFHGARIARGPDPARSRRDLVVLAAATRERASLAARQRALLAWWRAEGATERAGVSLAELAAEVERAARSRRRGVLARQTKRWERPSSSARAFELRDGTRGMARAELDDSALSDLIGRAWRAPRFDVDGDAFGFAGGATLLAMSGEPARVAAAFLLFARLADHALSAARPVLHMKQPEPGALFAVPRGAAPLGRMLAEGAVSRAEAARAVGRLHGALEDRGLSLELRGREPWIERGTCPRAWITPPAWIADRPLDLSGAPWRAAFAALAGATASERRSIALAWLEEQRSGARIRRALRARIEDDLGAPLDG